MPCLNSPTDSHCFNSSGTCIFCQIYDDAYNHQNMADLDDCKQFKEALMDAFDLGSAEFKAGKFRRTKTGRWIAKKLSIFNYRNGHASFLRQMYLAGAFSAVQRPKSDG
jgi:hypothetical protein